MKEMDASGGLVQELSFQKAFICLSGIGSSTYSSLCFIHIFWTRILALAMTCRTKNIDLSKDSFVASECMENGRWCVMNEEEDS